MTRPFDMTRQVCLTLKPFSAVFRISLFTFPFLSTRFSVSFHLFHGFDEQHTCLSLSRARPFARPLPFFCRSFLSSNRIFFLLPLIHPHPSCFLRLVYTKSCAYGCCSRGVSPPPPVFAPFFVCRFSLACYFLFSVPLPFWSFRMFMIGGV